MNSVYSNTPHSERKPLLGSALILALSLLQAGCGETTVTLNGGDSGATPETGSGTGTDGSTDGNGSTDSFPPVPWDAMSDLDRQVFELIEPLNLPQDPTAGRNLPDISSPLAQLGRKLFFSKSLGGQFDAACVSCHHPALGGADGLPLPTGVDAIDPDHLGPGRQNDSGLPVVPRNSPTVFNAGLWDSGMFHDSRVESLGAEAGANGSQSGIRTPDSDFGIADSGAGNNLPTAQARFPVTSTIEMRGDEFEANQSNDAVRAHLAARIGDYGEGAGELAQNDWLAEFQQAFGSSQPAAQLITFANIATAIGEYERSMVFVNSPWQRYLRGELDALSDLQKTGATLFFSEVENGGGGCFKCHSGALFSDGKHHNVGFPHFGPGTGDGAGGNDDFGRERETGDANDRYRFRTPSLLNVEVTGPYGHSGAYRTLNQAVHHYDEPRNDVEQFFYNGGWCDLPQFRNLDNCESLYPHARDNSMLALSKLENEIAADDTPFRETNFTGADVDRVVAFLKALTDPCVKDRDCLAPWIPGGSGPDGQQLNAVDDAGGRL